MTTMTENRTGPWPRIEIVVFPQSAFGSPQLADTPWDVQQVLTTIGVPRQLLSGKYAAMRDLEVLEVPTQGRVICFGTSGRWSRICLDPRNGEVTEVIMTRQPTANLVNSSLKQFIDSVQAITDLFPFYLSDSTLEDAINSGNNVADALKRIDPAAMGPDTFWSTFVDDLKMGDYPTEQVIEDLA
jgi:hypothetical protein